jgi:hypothetical protein
MSGRPMRAIHEYANLHKSSKHPHFNSNRWNERSCWRDAAMLENQVVLRNQQALHDAEFFSVSCDESTDKGKCSQMTVHVYVVINWVRVCIFLDLVNLELPATAQNIFEQLWQCLLKAGGLTEEHMIKRMVLFAADGAATLQGARNGVQKRLHDIMPKLLAMHCMAHRVQLVAKTTEECKLLSLALPAIKQTAKLYSKCTLRI